MVFTKVLRSLVVLAAFIVAMEPISYGSAETLDVCNRRVAVCKSFPSNIATLRQINCQMTLYPCLGRPVPTDVIKAYCNEWMITECRRYKSESYCRGDGVKKCVLDKQFGGNVRDHRTP